jgi:hypothetical protein
MNIKTPRITPITQIKSDFRSVESEKSVAYLLFVHRQIDGEDP